MKKKKAEEQPKSTKLPREDFLEIRNNHLQMEVLKTQLNSIGIIIENHDRGKQLAVLQRNDLKVKIARLEADHEVLLNKIKEKTGIVVKGMTINPETLEVT